MTVRMVFLMVLLLGLWWCVVVDTAVEEGGEVRIDDCEMAVEDAIVGDGGAGPEWVERTGVRLGGR